MGALAKAMRVWKPVLAAALAVAACGPKTGLPGSGATPTPSPGASPRPAVVAEYPNARLLVTPQGGITLKPGDQVVIDLPTEKGFEPWSHPRAMDLNVMAPLYPPVAGTDRTAFTAMAPGTTRLEANTTPECKPPTPLPTGQGYACPAIARVWDLDVTVAGGGRGPTSILVEGLFDEGFTLRLRAGDRVTLPADLTDATDSNPAVLAPLGRGADGTQRFSARAAGTATLTAQTDLPCMHSHPACEIATRLMLLVVTVS